MKKLLSILVLFCTLLVMSCEEPEEVNPFIGTWEKVNDSNVRFVYTDTIATGYVQGLGYVNDISWTGTYTYDDTHITVILDKELSTESMLIGWPNGYICQYEFKDDLLMLSNPATMTFKKISD
ncbi:MAG: hypothetical protein FWC19_06345 [Treponema sp.]|nr:hypothetical protein [Treponema sp.]